MEITLIYSLNYYFNLLYKNQEWWSYEFCYKKHLIQYHEAKPTDPPEHNMRFCLGKYPTLEELEKPDFKYQKEIYKRGPFGKNYLTQMMVDGTICDITGKPRKAELRVIIIIIILIIIFFF